MNRFFRGTAAFPPLALALGLAGATALAQEPPDQPLEEVVQAFAGKELEYATAHPRYNYRLTVRIQELDKSDNVIGSFEQDGLVTFDRRGRRQLTLLANPHSDLTRLDLQRIELDDLVRIPLFILDPEEISRYDVSYLTSETVDEVRTHLFHLGPKGVPHPPEVYFEGIVYVDARKLDIVRASGRLVPAYTDGALGRLFQHVEIYRQPVDEYMFTTYVRSNDVISARRGEEVNARLIVRFRDYSLAEDPEKNDDAGATEEEEPPPAEPPAEDKPPSP